MSKLSGYRTVNAISAWEDRFLLSNEQKTIYFLLKFVDSEVLTFLTNGGSAY